jgi:pentatricopeptide repeat protein
VSDSLVYRYNPRASPDGVRGAEGTFSACSFWYVAALARAGRLEEARLAFEKMLTYGNGPACRADQPHRGAARELPPGIDAPGADQRRVQP